MKISFNWLKDYLDCALTPQEVCDALTSIGLEVDGMETIEQIPGGLEGVVVAEVVSCEAHPDSDHLHVTQVNAGTGELLQVVCGAPNVAAGQKVLLATVGTVLGGDFKIKKSRIRGVDSLGMICAEDELGIGDDHSGIMVLRPDAVPGTPAREYLNLKTDALIEIGLTANRVDAASHIGVARDLYACLRHRDVPCRLTLPDVPEWAQLPVKPALVVPVEVEAPDGAPRYTATTIRGVRIAPSPQFIQERLLAVGLRPINNVVDITNFVLMEIGQPLHAFDEGRIGGARIVVRRAQEGEKFVTLDGVERTLSGEDLMICDASRPMCLAGVFGGADSGVSDTTVDLVLESAYFDPSSIRKSSRRHGLKTDAAFRYERGCDPLVCEWAARRAASLILEYAGGSLAGPVQVVDSGDFARKRIRIDYGWLKTFVGKDLGAETVEGILEGLNYNFLEKSAEGCTVEAPSYMIDVYRPCDVAEEILRIYGYDNIDLPAGMKASVNPSPHPEPEAVRSALSDFLSANGFVEIMNNSLTKGEYYEGLETFPAEKCVRILNPLSSDLNVMRQSLIQGGLEVISYNIKRQTSAMRLFELGSVYSFRPDGDGRTLSSYEEHVSLSLFLTGTRERTWLGDVRKSDFFRLKGYFELLLKRLGTDIHQLYTSRAPMDMFASGVCYSLPGRREPFAVLGAVSGARLRQFDIKQPVYAAEIRWDALMELVSRNRIRYSELPRYPEVRRDLALLVDETVDYAALRACALKAGRKHIKDIILFDVYKGDKIPQDKKQYALGFTLSDAEKTLTDADVEGVMQKILSALEKECGALLR